MMVEQAIEAVRSRTYWSPFQESPARRNHPEGAKQAGLERFEGWQGTTFALQDGPLVGEEISPWTGEPLGIRYPARPIERLIEGGERALGVLAGMRPQARVRLCERMLERLAADAFTNAFATMHTTGQPFVMAFAGSGANSLDRGLEALAMAAIAMEQVPASATFVRRFGPGEPVRLDKRYHLVPRGLTVVFSCATYPAWNAYPALFASLATGNPVLLKPHPSCILPMARAVQLCRQVLAEHGLDEDAMQLALDHDGLIGLQLADHPAVATIDFTGSPRFGAVLEQRRKLVYTETAGCNPVVLHSTDDLDATLEAVAHSFCCFSGQMCTTAQNVFVPEDGVRTPLGEIGPDEVEARLIDRVDALVSGPHAEALCGTVQDPGTLAAVQAFGEPLRAPEPIALSDWPRARTTSPVIVRGSGELHRREHFGPIGFCIRVPDAEEGLRQATRDAAEHGAIASYVYATDESFLDRAERAFVRAGASVGFNLHRQRPINYAAAYSDFHVTGLNPAGTACLTDLAFVADRFRIVQSKRERPVPAS